MASITLRLDSRYTKNGMQQIRVRISHNNTNSWIPTGVWVEPECFSTDSIYEPISKKATMSHAKSVRIADLVTKINKTIMALDMDDPTALSRMCANDIRNMCTGACVCKPNKPQKIVRTSDFMQLFDQYAQSRTNENTRRHYDYVLRLLSEYMRENRLAHIYVGDVDYALLSNIKRWVISSGRGDATRFKVESYMRAVYKEAERLKMVSRDASPYFDYKIAPIPIGDIETIEVDTIRRMLSLDLTRYPGMLRARDIVMASFYLCGANLIDIYNMPSSINGEAVFIRHKVAGKCHRHLHIAIEPELQDILSRRGGVDGMFDCKEHAPYYNYQRKVNKLLSDISTKVGAKITFEMMRRTWATIASELEVPDRVIDKSMGHVDTSVKDKYYEKYDWGRTRSHNRRIIDYLWQGVEINSINIKSA